jgi:hypothetical protein
MTETIQALTDQEVEKLARDWYHALDVHVPIDELWPMLATEGLKFVFPEGERDGTEGFRVWYDAVTHRFFDEVHTVKQVESKPNGNTADVSVVVNWQAKIWDAPEAKSKWLGFDAYQTWLVARGPEGTPVIQKYVVDSLKPMEGSAAL